MGMTTGGGGGGVKADINVTPLVDVVLVLLIIFMVVTPMLQRGKDVRLPKAAQKEQQEGQSADPLILSMTPDKKMYLENDAYDEPNLEAALKTIPLVGQACAIGDARKFVSALLVLDPDTSAVWAKANSKEGTSLAELARDPDVLAAVQSGIDEVNKQFAQVEQIKKFTLIGEEWLPDSDVLTPTSKLKRRGVHARYAAEIEEMYAGA